MSTTGWTPRKQARANIEFYQDAGLLDGEPIIDERLEALWDGSFGTMELFFRGLRLLLNHAGDPYLKMDCFAYALGRADMVGVKSITDLAVKHFHNPKKKWRVNKLVLQFQECMGLKAMPGQRSALARRAMHLARQAQLDQAQPALNKATKAKPRSIL